MTQNTQKKVDPRRVRIVGGLATTTRFGQYDYTGTIRGNNSKSFRPLQEG